MRLYQLAGASFMLGLAGTPALAQEAAQEGASEATGDIIVTARRRAENLQDVPISIVAIDGETLNERNVKTENDLPSVAAGLSVANTAANRLQSTFSIRGQGQTFGQNSPGVVAYFAEVADFSSTFYDLESIQVLKGPQGTLFGRNTTGGAVLFVPRKPGNDIEGYAMFRVGSYGRHDAEFGVGGAIVPDKLMVRLAGQFLHRGGFTRNLFNGTKTDNENRDSFRVSVLLRSVDAVENYTIFQMQDIDESGSGAAIGGFNAANPTFLASAPGVPALLPSLQAALAAQQARGPRVIDVNQPLGNGLRSHGVINTTSVELGEHFTVRNIFSHRWYKMFQNYDIDGTRLPILDVYNPFQNGFIKQRTEEVQARAEFGVFDGVVGYYTERTRSPAGSVGFDTTQYVQLPPIPGLLPAGYLGPVRAEQVTNGSVNTSEAFYGEFNLRPFQGLTLTAGIRRTKDFRSSSTRGAVLTIPGLPPLPFGAPTSASGTFKATTWNVAALYEATPDLSLYATVRRGYKSGGFNGTAINPADQFFQPETVTDYEFGIKSNWDLGTWRLRANLDLFYDDYQNIQRYVNLNTVPASTVTRNAAAGSIKGVDLDLLLSAPNVFSLDVKYTYLDAQYDSYLDPTLGDLSNSRFPNTPRHQLNVTPRFEIPTAESFGKLSVQGSIFYRSLIAFDPVNRFNGNPLAAISVPGSTSQGFTRIDLRADWRNALDSRFSVAAFVRNLTDKEYIVGGNNQLPTQFGTVSYLYGEPRMFGAELRIDF